MSKPRDYSNAKIYKIVDNTNDNIYVGSTTKKYLSQRLSGHMKSFRRYKNGKSSYVTSFQILENNDFDIILLENVCCKTVDELRARERYHIETNKCVNKVIPTRTDAEYRQQHINEIREKNIIYSKTHQEERKTYREQHKTEILKKAKEYRDTHKNEITTKQKEYGLKRFTCECGTECRWLDKSKHFKTKKHQSYIQSFSEQI
jgi:hypothetical protein